MSRPVTVLNVNDDAATRYLLSRILKQGGYEVAEAATGEEALRVIASSRPHLVLLDIKLPDISGLEVCRRIKAQPGTATLLVVQTSATYASSDRRAEGLDSGADAYLSQPVSPDELLATVRALLRTQQAEARERRALERVQRVFDAIQQPLFVVNADGVIEDCNGAAGGLLGPPGGPPLRGRGCAEALGEIVPGGALDELLRRARDGRHEIEVTRGGRHFCVSGDPLPGEDGAFEGVVIILTDVSDRKRLEGELRARAEQLAEAGRRKDEFLGMLAHELRNPLNAISAAAAVWGRTVAHDANGERLLAVINRQARNLARLVDDLLEAARIERGLLQIRREAVDLAQLVRRAVQGAQTVFEGRGQRVALGAPEVPLVVDGDELRLEQVVVNLLTNASKFSGAGSTIDVRLEAKADGEGRVAEVRVRDPGVGIPREMLDKIFEPFVQVEPSLARSLGGLGIGLSMVKSLVDLHGGRVEAASDGAGRGAEFVVRLPLKNGHARLPTPRPTQVEARARPRRVLVIEDNEDALELVQAWLTHLGHSVQGASDGARGLELALASRPEVAFIDIGLPGIDGYEVARRLRAASDGAPLYLVAVTGYGQPEDRIRALEAGFDTHVVKPLSEAALREALDPARLAERFGRA
jgi:signal transduction histidine kinase